MTPLPAGARYGIGDAAAGDNVASTTLARGYRPKDIFCPLPSRRQLRRIRQLGRDRVECLVLHTRLMPRAITDA
jgi:hypothetical protein